MRTHYRLTARGTAVACGRDIPSTQSTDRIGSVDCQRCMSTDRYKNAIAIRAARLSAPAYNAAAPEPMDAERVFTESSVKAILDGIFETANDEAENQGVCETYTEILDVVEGALPGWYKMPERKRSWSLYINSDNRYTDSMTKDELIEAIKDNPEDFITIEAS